MMLFRSNVTLALSYVYLGQGSAGLSRCFVLVLLLACCFSFPFSPPPGLGLFDFFCFQVFSPASTASAFHPFLLLLPALICPAAPPQNDRPRMVRLAPPLE